MSSITALLLAVLRQSENQSRCTQVSDLRGAHEELPRVLCVSTVLAINKGMGHLELSIRLPGLQQRPGVFSHDSETYRGS